MLFLAAKVQFIKHVPNLVSACFRIKVLAGIGYFPWTSFIQFQFPLHGSSFFSDSRYLSVNSVVSSTLPSTRIHTRHFPLTGSITGSSGLVLLSLEV